mgnify:CR=1 FL=1
MVSRLSGHCGLAAETKGLHPISAQTPQGFGFDYFYQMHLDTAEQYTDVVYLPFLYKKKDQTNHHKKMFQLSDTLVKELKDSDVIIISAPIYNYGPPATLKAWSDLAARVDAVSYTHLRAHEP